MKEKLLISACLMGENCKYNGKNNYLPAVELLKLHYELIPVCPEQLGGLPTPRQPSECRGDRVFSADGRDVTEAFLQGAEQALALAGDCRAALLKERSPSCGHKEIYDGTFTGKICSGSGVTARLLQSHGFALYGESEADHLLKNNR